MRSVMIGLVAVAVLLGGCSDEENTAKAAEKSNTGPTEIVLSGQDITDEMLSEKVKVLTNLERLYLDDTQITDAGLVHLAGLSNLKDLNLDSTQVTDAGLVHLKGLTKLTGLSLGYPNRNGIFEEIFWKTQPGADHHDDTKVTDAGLVHLKGLTNLEWLDLMNTKITDAGLVHLKGLTKLRNLNLEGTKITDAGLVHLKGLTKLEELHLDNTKVTDAGVQELKKALPNCGIYRGNPDEMME